MDVPTVEIVDLPGIQMIPAKVYEDSKALVNKFMGKDDRLTIVLCVVPANEGSLGDTALSLIQQPSRTIVALTKADKVELEDPDEVRDQLFLPLLGRHESIKGMGGCVAVSNRKHNVSISLEDQRVCEAALFASILATAAGEYATDAIQQQLTANMGSKQLIVQLAAMYRRHVVKHWIPQAQLDAEVKRSEAEGQLRSRGDRPEVLQKKLEGTLAGIQAKVMQRNACYDLHRMLLIQCLEPYAIHEATHTMSTRLLTHPKPAKHELSANLKLWLCKSSCCVMLAYTLTTPACNDDFLGLQIYMINVRMCRSTLGPYAMPWSRLQSTPYRLSP